MNGREASRRFDDKATVGFGVCVCVCVCVCGFGVLVFASRLKWHSLAGRRLLASDAQELGWYPIGDFGCEKGSQ